MELIQSVNVSTFELIIYTVVDAKITITVQMLQEKVHHLLFFMYGPYIWYHTVW